MGRAEVLAGLRQPAPPFDVIVVGAGINGTGIARDAALRGLRVLLLEKNDLASGTTSWSSRLIHGGLRYLEHREVGLVRESLRERERLLRIAPHLVKPLPLLIPLYKGARRGPLLIRLGMIAYDVLSYDKSLDRHRMLSRDEALQRAPGLATAGLRGAAMYFDGQVEYAERLAVENALDAAESGAQIVTHARVDRLLRDGNTVFGVGFTDLLDGGAFEARAGVTVNVAGPWVDSVLAADDSGKPLQTPLIGGTKGSHIVVDPFPGAPHDALYVEAKQDGRPFFVIPWNELYLIGTTDVRYEGDLDRVVASEEEIAYLLDETLAVMPDAGLSRESVRYTYSGVRPLPHSEDGSEAAITRRHIVRDHGPEAEGLLSIVGGKLTTFRELSEQVVDTAGKRLGRKLPESVTADRPLPGSAPVDGRDFPAYKDWLLARCELPARTVEHLLRVYGTRAGMVLELADREPTLRDPIDPGSGAIGAEVVHAIESELAETVTDVLLRRTMSGLGRNVGLEAIEPAAEVGRRYLGWDVARVEQEVAAYREYVSRFQPRAMATGS